MPLRHSMVMVPRRASRLGRMPVGGTKGRAVEEPWRAWLSGGTLHRVFGIWRLRAFR